MLWALKPSISCHPVSPLMPRVYLPWQLYYLVYVCFKIGYTHISILFFHIDYYRTLSRPPCPIHTIGPLSPLYIVVCMCQPHAPIHPSPLGFYVFFCSQFMSFTDSSYSVSFSLENSSNFHFFVYHKAQKNALLSVLMMTYRMYHTRIISIFLWKSSGKIPTSVCTLTERRAWG